jgi:trimeric autotransporter adhesin
VGGAVNAWTLGGNAFGAPGLIGTLDSNPITVFSNGAAANLLLSCGNGLRVQVSGSTTLGVPNVINGSSANQVTSGVRGATIAGGGANLDDPFYVGANGNSVTDAYGTVGGGHSNRAGTLTGAPLTSTSSTVAGGDNNVAEGFASAVTGGSQNKASGVLAVVGGGLSNQATGLHSAVFGGQGNLASGEKAFVGGGNQNQADGNATVAGGIMNLATGGASFIGGGTQNSASGSFGIVAGGLQNEASGSLATVGGGNSNRAPNRYAAVVGGVGNLASGDAAFVGGGQSNTASGGTSVVAGGDTNRSSGSGSSVLGGYRNIAQGDYSTATGYLAEALNQGSFVWADVSYFPFTSTADNQFNVRATGGARFVTAIDGAGAPTRTVSINPNGTLDFGSNIRQNINLWGSGLYGIGVQSGTQYYRTSGPTAGVYGFSWFLDGVHSDSPNAPGAGGVELMRLSTNGDLKVKGSIAGGVILNTSDRNVKSLIQSINPQAILAKVAAMPISRWVYNADEKKSWHLGPMAQDFRAAFGLGQDDKTIATVDAGGVALAAIQGLNAKVMAQIKAKDSEIASLRKAQDVLLQKLTAIEKRLGR